MPLNNDLQERLDDLVVEMEQFISSSLKMMELGLEPIDIEEIRVMLFHLRKWQQFFKND